MSKQIDFKLEKVFGPLQGCAIVAFLLDKDYRMAQFVGILRMELKIAAILNSGISIFLALRKHKCWISELETRM